MTTPDLIAALYRPLQACGAWWVADNHHHDALWMIHFHVGDGPELAQYLADHCQGPLGSKTAASGLARTMNALAGIPGCPDCGG